MVAAWIKADTGVGPSIASGNQVWRPSCADLLTTAIIKQKPINGKVATEKLKIKSVVASEK